MIDGGVIEHIAAHLNAWLSTCARKPAEHNDILGGIDATQSMTRLCACYLKHKATEVVGL